MTFPIVRRGFDPDRVRSYLDKLASELRDARDHEAALRTEVESLQARLDSAMRPDDAQLAAALGEETARVLLAAREAAAEIRSKGEESVARLLREAQEEASAVRAEAETILTTRTQEAEAAVAEVREKAETEAAAVKAETERAVAKLREEADAVIARARAEAERLRSEASVEAEAVVEEARERGRAMLEEAQLVRGRMLEDLARKRKAARIQLERLQAGRERLLDSYDVVRRTLQEATDELSGSLVAAKQAADVAARRAEAEPPASVDELESELDAARDAGLPLVSDEEPDADTADDFADLPEGEMPEIEPSADFEEVRVIEEREPDGDAVDVVVEEITIEEVVLVDDAPDEPVADEQVAEEPVVSVDDAADEEPDDEEPDNDQPDDDESVDVDGLFARIRAARAEQVAKAREVLADDDESDDVADEAGEDEFAPEPPAPDEQALLERRDALVEAAEQAATRKLKRVLADEQNDVLDRLRRNAKSAVDDLLPAVPEHAARYADAARDALAGAAAAGAAFYGDGVSAGSVDDLADALGEALASPLRDRVAASLREAAGDDDALADGVRAAYRDWKTHRIALQTRDTVFAAFNRGLYDAIADGTAMRWLVDDGGSPCPDAEDNSLAGLVVKGDPYPTGHCFPPAHPGCRCLLVPPPH